VAAHFSTWRREKTSPFGKKRGGAEKLRNSKVSERKKKKEEDLALLLDRKRGKEKGNWTARGGEEEGADESGKAETHRIGKGKKGGRFPSPRTRKKKRRAKEKDGEERKNEFFPRSAR